VVERARDFEARLARHPYDPPPRVVARE